MSFGEAKASGAGAEWQVAERGVKRGVRGQDRAGQGGKANRKHVGGVLTAAAS